MERVTSNLLFKAAEDGDLASLRRHVKAGSNINTKGYYLFGLYGWYQCTPLHVASFHGKRNVVEFLVRFGCDISIQTLGIFGVKWTFFGNKTARQVAENKGR